MSILSFTKIDIFFVILVDYYLVLIQKSFVLFICYYWLMYWYVIIQEF